MTSSLHELPPRRPSRTATIFTVADTNFFPGLVALLNSLRLTGRDDPVTVLDCGLTSRQRALVEGHVTLVQPQPGLADNPLLHKPFPALLDPRGVVVIIDSDMVVTSSLDEVIERAAQGKVCLMHDESQDDRWFPEWEEAFDLRAPLREQRYLNSGFIAFAVESHPDLLQRWWSASQSIPVEQTRAKGAQWTQPFWDGDQDALNALLMSEIPESALSIGAQHVTDVMLRVTVEDPVTLRCTDAGSVVTILHHTGTPKPWRTQAWMRVRRNPYVTLLPRLLFADDLAVRMAPTDVPYWLRPDVKGRAALAVLGAANAGGRAVVRRTNGPVRHGLRRMRDVLAREGHPR